MDISRLVIAVDGWSSTGKSTFAKLVAKEFGLLYLDSGALYRGVTLFAQEEGLVSEDGEVDPRLEEALRSLDLHFGEGGKLYSSDRCIEEQIRSLKVSGQVSPVSAVAYVRDFVNARLHESGRDGGIVMDGRDIGTTVFPDADIKIFMTASAEVRARRRYDEMIAKGDAPTMEEVARNLRERDYIDSHREVSPLSKAPDAIELDNSSMTLPEEIDWLKALVKARYGVCR